jgi:hypothetical protein
MNTRHAFAYIGGCNHWWLLKKEWTVGGSGVWSEGGSREDKYTNRQACDRQACRGLLPRLEGAAEQRMVEPAAASGVRVKDGLEEAELACRDSKAQRAIAKRQAVSTGHSQATGRVNGP